MLAVNTPCKLVISCFAVYVDMSTLLTEVLYLPTRLKQTTNHPHQVQGLYTITDRRWICHEDDMDSEMASCYKSRW